MMNVKMQMNLQKIFWLLGWLVLFVAFLNVLATCYEYFFPLKNMPHNTSLLYYVHHMEILFYSVGQAFFAFLISVVFKMLFNKTKVKRQQAERFLIVSCIGFIGGSLLGFILWLQPIGAILSQFQFSSKEAAILLVLGHLIRVLPHLISFIYAITIYILFHHFSRLITFESEVI